MAKPIPDYYPRVTPYLIIEDAAAAIGFYSSVLGASERVPSVQRRRWPPAEPTLLSG
jgi:hypothetical protein